VGWETVDATGELLCLARRPNAVHVRFQGDDSLNASTARRLVATVLATAGLLSSTSAAQADPTPDLETLTGTQAEQMLHSGQITSVQLVRAYMARIAALNKSGPGLNAVTQINPDALSRRPTSITRGRRARTSARRWACRS
jgi:uncharacterized protein (UPF0297 family)